ncbi:MAG: hypothetical protein DMF66_16890 [Acidobacteria bacterium]|nr:MAG: hypothetical protein DMF66_16890 [Acidobacteriota bacterium]
MIGTGLIPPFERSSWGTGAPWAECELGMMADMDELDGLDPSADAGAMSLARVRQLAAHETGHTLGLAHNFAASTYGRASVMDYPAPMVEIKNGRLDLSNAYAVGIGAYDKFAIRFAYAQFAPGTDETSELEKVVDEGVKSGMLFISDADARPAGAAHPLANLWDNGDDPVAMLRHEMEVRRIALSQFGLANVPNGTPLSLLEAKLLPLYLHHRYQLQAAVKSVGGLYYTYAVKTAAGPSPPQVQQVVPAARQRDALNAVLDTIKVEELAVPPRILALIPPRAFGYEGGTQELFAKRTDPAFDPLAAATIAADLAVSGLLEPHRAARLNQYHSLDRVNPDFAEVAAALVARTWRPPAPKDAYLAAITRSVQGLVVTRLMDLAADADASVQVRAVATEQLRSLLVNDTAMTSADEATNAHLRATHEDIERFLARPAEPRKRTPPPPAPPGDPIGAGKQHP